MIKGNLVLNNLVNIWVLLSFSFTIIDWDNIFLSYKNQLHLLPWIAFHTMLISIMYVIHSILLETKTKTKIQEARYNCFVNVRKLHKFQITLLKEIFEGLVYVLFIFRGYRKFVSHSMPSPPGLSWFSFITTEMWWAQMSAVSLEG